MENSSICILINVNIFYFSLFDLKFKTHISKSLRTIPLNIFIYFVFNKKKVLKNVKRP